jgi:hypothetical protein
MKEFHEVEVEGEKIFLRKDFLGWHTIFPYTIDGKKNWKNILAGGSWWKLIFAVGFVIIMIGAIIEVSNVYKIANDCLNPVLNITSIDFTNIKLP